MWFTASRNGRAALVGFVVILASGAGDAGAADAVVAAPGSPEATAPSVVEGAPSAAAGSQSALREALLRAIRERRVVSFNYGGHPRTVEPHAYGLSGAGEEALNGFQISGGSSSVPPPGWRTFTVAEMGELVVTGIGFGGPRPDYVNTGRFKLDPVWAELTTEGVPLPAAAVAPGKVE